MSDFGCSISDFFLFHIVVFISTTLFKFRIQVFYLLSTLYGKFEIEHSKFEISFIKSEIEHPKFEIKNKILI